MRGDRIAVPVTTQIKLSDGRQLNTTSYGRVIRTMLRTEPTNVVEQFLISVETGQTRHCQIFLLTLCDVKPRHPMLSKQAPVCISAVCVATRPLAPPAVDSAGFTTYRVGLGVGRRDRLG